MRRAELNSIRLALPALRGWLLTGLWAMAWFGAPGQLGAQSRRNTGLEDFPTLAQRNIFDPTRSPSRPPPAEYRPERQETPRRSDFISLSGTMLYGENSFAFFHGSQSDYRQILGLEETLGGFKVAGITTAHVVLQGQTNQWILPVGGQLRRDGDGPWTVITTGAPLPGPRPDSTSEPGRNESAPARPEAGAVAGETKAGPPSEEMSDLLKRMMERRQKEISP